MARDYGAIVDFLKSKIRTKNRKIKTHTGSLVSDVVIEGPAEEFHRLYEKSESVSKNQSLETADPEGVRSLGFNENKKKKLGTPANAVITFFSNNPIDSDIIIPAGTIVSTRIGISTSDVRFRVLQTLRMYATLSSIYFNLDTGKYEISVEAECESLGTIGNIGAYNINTIIGSITGINGCYNALPASGGTDIENENAFKRRVAIAKQGNSIGTTQGLLNIILENERVEDALLIGNKESTRDYIGAVDIYIKGLKVKQSTDTFLVRDNTTEFSFTKKPITYSPAQVLIFSNDSLSSVSYEVEKDTTSEHAGSILAEDKIVWASALDPALGSAYIIYSYNCLIEELQNLFNAEDKDLQNTNILIHWANEIGVDITFSMRTLSGFQEAEVKQEIRDNLAAFFAATKIGEEIQQSDVVGIIINTPGVDDIILPLYVFRSSDGSVTQNTLGNLQIPFNSYASLGTSTINVVI